jgi:hypothetical protein
MNLNPSQWGPYYWNMLHFMSSSYDNNPNPSVQSVMKNFIQSLPVFLPCKECQDHAFHFIKSKNLDKVVESRKDLFTFFFNFHNFVNERLGKPIMDIKTALEKYFIPKEEYHLYTEYELSKASTKSYLQFGTVLLILCILLIIFFK